MSKTTTRFALLAAALALFVAACGGAPDGDTARAEVADESGGAESEATAVASEEEAAGDDVVAPAAGVTLVDSAQGRQIVSTATIELDVEEAEEVTAEVARLVAAAGGFVAGEDTTNHGGTRSSLVLRVPPEEFSTVLVALADLGDVRAQRIETDEVTEQVVDLQSRIASAEASVDRVRSLLERAGAVDELAQVEAELLQRETTLETLRGQLRTIEQQVALATIHVELSSEGAAPVVEPDDELPSFLGGLATGWDGLVVAFATVSAAVGVLLPWLVLAAVMGLPTWRIVRSRRLRERAPAAG
ncbi:MAG: DUF4349 domain-containing protein [Actinomycetota bacterium]